MLLQTEREEVVRCCRLLISRGLTRGTGGNISIRRGDKTAVSPSGVEYDVMRPEDVVVTDMQGNILDGSLRPSSELELHLACYHARPDAGAVVHTHSTFATVIACMGREIPPVHYLIGFAGGAVPCIPYYPFGSETLANAAAAAMSNRNAVLLGNHGLVACGENIGRAFAAAEETEFVAELYYRTELLGGGRMLTDADMAEAMARFAYYGQEEK